MHKEVLPVNLKGTKHLMDIGVNGRNMTKWTMKK
jgi:hypothetical protein